MMLTAGQTRTYQFIRRYVTQYGFAPTIREITEGLGLKARSAIHRNLQAIEKEGLIQLLPQRRRNIVLLQNVFYHLPIMGKIAAGHPIEAIEDDRTLDLPAIIGGEGRYILEVRGDSMIGDNICDGDYVLCEKRKSVRDGEIVVALVDKQEATLKRLYRNPDQTVTLSPSNSQLSPMVFAEDRVEVQGVYLGLVRLTAGMVN